jgi:hypothetical protein
MKTTVDIPDNELADAMKFTGRQNEARCNRHRNFGLQPKTPNGRVGEILWVE